MDLDFWNCKTLGIAKFYRTYFGHSRERENPVLWPNKYDVYNIYTGMQKIHIFFSV